MYLTKYFRESRPSPEGVNNFDVTLIADDVIWQVFSHTSLINLQAVDMFGQKCAEGYKVLYFNCIIPDGWIPGNMIYVYRSKRIVLKKNLEDASIIGHISTGVLENLPDFIIVTSVFCLQNHSGSFHKKFLEILIHEFYAYKS